MGSWFENKVCSGALLARCYFEATEIDCGIDQLITLLITHTGTRSSTQTVFLGRLKAHIFDLAT